MDIPSKYILANGPEGLEKVLNELLEKSKKDSAFASQEHFVLYQLGEQKSLIRVDTDKKPFLFWHYDLLGRPMTMVVKNTIDKFLSEKFGVKQ